MYGMVHCNTHGVVIQPGATMMFAFWFFDLAFSACDSRVRVPAVDQYRSLDLG